VPPVAEVTAPVNEVPAPTPAPVEVVSQPVQGGTTSIFENQDI